MWNDSNPLLLGQADAQAPPGCPANQEIWVVGQFELSGASIQSKESRETNAT
jgi:hypothetical protein